MKKINKTKIIVLVLITLAIILAMMGSVFDFSKTEDIVELAEIETKFYIVQKEYQYGVIDVKR